MDNAFLRSRRGFLALGGAATVLATTSSPVAATAATKADNPGHFPAIVPTAAGDGLSDDTHALQDAIDQAGDRCAAVVLAPGVYAVRSLTISNQVRLIGLAGGKTRFPKRGRWGGVMIVPFEPSARGPLVTVDSGGTGVQLENIVIDGFNPAMSHGMSPTEPSSWANRVGLTVAGGIEVQLHDVRVSRFRDSGITITHLNNSRWTNVYVDNCGSTKHAAMTIGSPPTGATNYNVFDGLTIERSRNTALAIAAGPNPVIDFASNLTFIGLHVEASQDSAVSFLNTSALIDVGNVRALTFVSPQILGAPVPLISYDQRVDNRTGRPGSPGGDPGDQMGGFFLLGGHLKQHGGATSGTRSASILVKGYGSQFGATNVVFASLVTTGVILDPSYQGGATIEGCSFRNGGSEQQRTVFDQRDAVYRNFTVSDTFGDVVLAYGRLRSRASKAEDGTTLLVNPRGDTIATWTRPGIHGSDMAGSVNVVVSRETRESLATVEFGSGFIHPPVVTLTPLNRNTAALGLYATVKEDASSFTVHSALAVPASSTPLSFNYMVIGVE